MKKLPVILDLETKYTFREKGKHKDLGISAIGIYDYATEQSQVFLESEIHKLFQTLEEASYLIGFNIKSFDMKVLQAYYPGDLSRFPVFDMLDDIKDKIGKRLSLNDILRVTLGKRKSGHGLLAIELFKEKKWDELKDYCQSDVTLTKELFDHGVRKGEVSYQNEVGTVSIAVEWRKLFNPPSYTDRPLTLPF